VSSSVTDTKNYYLPCNCTRVFAEIQAQVHSVGLCGTDMHYYLAGNLFGEPLTEPMVMGHETAAEVVKVGRNVTDLKPGIQNCIILQVMIPGAIPRWTPLGY